ncbi:MAG: ABC transporter substrate-binding protein, partial [Pseudomonadota bacterium]
MSSNSKGHTLRSQLFFNPLCCFLLVFLLSATSSARADSLDPFRFQLLWTPQAQFLGYYVADVLGYYEEEGLAVDIIPGGPTTQTTELLLSRDVDAVNEWLSTALAARQSGLPIINVAQLLQHTGFALICHRDRGIRQPLDLKGKVIGVWNNGTHTPVATWLAQNGVSLDDIPLSARLVEQAMDVVEAWNDPAIDCVSAMSYNEYWTLLEYAGSPTELTIFDFSDLGFDFLEDGIYVDERRLNEPEFRDRLARFLAASLRGWEYALQRPEESITMLTALFPELDRRQQIHMINDIARLIDADELPLGYMRVEAYDQTVGLFLPNYSRVPFLASREGRGWTHAIWSQLEETSEGVYDAEVRYRLDQVLNYRAFYILDLVGTLAFAIAGLARAQVRQYSVWGAFALAGLAATGGGTLRDLLVGGDRHPPFIFHDPNYLYIVVGIVLLGSIINALSPQPMAFRSRFPRTLLVIDTV